MKNIFLLLFLMLILGVLAGCGHESDNPLYDDPEPAKPVKLQTKLLPSGVHLTWAASSGASKYQIFRQTTTEEKRLIGTSPTTQFDDTGVVDETVYTYTVRGVGPGDNLGDGLIGLVSEPKVVQYCSPKLKLTSSGDLDFGTDRMTLKLSFVNCGGGDIAWNLPNDIPWARFQPSNGHVGSEPVEVTITVDRSSCEPKIFDAVTTLKGNLGPPITLHARMEIPNQPVLSVEPEQISLCPGEGMNLMVGNTGTGMLQWRIADGANWLDVTPLDGTVTCGQITPVILQVLNTDPAPREETVDLRVVWDGGEKVIPITRHVPEPDVNISLSRILLEASNNWQATVTLTNGGDCAVAWQADPSATWLVVEPRGGQLQRNASQQIQVRGTAQSLDAGTYPDDQICFVLNGRQDPNDCVDVTLTRRGTIHGRLINIFTRSGISSVTVTTPAGSATTDNTGGFEIAYDQTGTFPWTAEHPAYLSSEGSVTGRRGEADIGTVALIPIPQSVDEVRPDLNGFDTPWSVALSEDERQACIVNRDGGTVSLVDTQINAVVETIEVGQNPLGAVYGDGQLFVGSWDNTITIIHPVRREKVETIEMRGLPSYLVVCSGKLYVTLQDAISGNQVAVMDIGTRRVERRIPVGSFPHGVVVDPFCRSLYVANHDGDTLSSVPLGAGGGILIPVGPNPQGAAISPSGRYVYTADAGQISRVDVERNIVERFAQRDTRFGWVAVIELPEDKGDLVYATDTRNNLLWVWHPTSGKWKTVDVSASPFGVAATRDGRRVYVCNAEGNTVEVFGNW